MINRLFNPEKGTWVFCSFLAFFGAIVAVNAVFISTALRTHSGVITTQAYEKGLAYDEILEVAKAQPDIKQKASFEGGVLRWSLKDVDGQNLDANVRARLVRPVKDGQDFEVVLVPNSNGAYEAELNLPMKGRWDALLKAEWQKQQYQTRLSFIAK